MPQKVLGPIFCLLCIGACVVQGKEFCFGVNNEQYRCEMGYCCGETECCTYYYELWWFWLVWTLIIMLSCCCAYRHRRVKMRLQQEQRQREISLMAYQGASSSFVAPPPLNLRFWTDCKLPAYEEVAGHPPTPPPPYSEASPAGTPVPGLILLPAGQLQSTVVVEPIRHVLGEPALPVQEQDRDSVAGTPQSSRASPRLSESGGGRCDPPPQPGSRLPPPGEEAGMTYAPGDQEDCGTRRRHVTGDSGIEVCVCQLDVDEDFVSEGEEVESGRLCQGASGDCCSERSTDRQKDHLDSSSGVQISDTGVDNGSGLV
ncbi:WBP1L protein, partial [Atractosteus spatula]|nr:WBP1L protein [Atractosteus spatula]